MADLKPCGTLSAYDRHRQRGEHIDEACREVRNAYSAAYGRALRILRDRHPAEYQELRAAADGSTYRGKPGGQALAALARDRNAEFLAIVADLRAEAAR